MFDVDGDGELSHDDMVGSVNIGTAALQQFASGLTLPLKMGGNITITSTWDGPHMGKMWFSCSNLPCNKNEDTVDPIIGVYAKPEGHAQFDVVLGQTEHQTYEPNPTFQTPIVCNV